MYTSCTLGSRPFPQMMPRSSMNIWSSFTVRLSPLTITFHSAWAFPRRMILIAKQSGSKNTKNFVILKFIKKFYDNNSNNNTNKQNENLLIWNFPLYSRWHDPVGTRPDSTSLFPVECRTVEYSPLRIEVLFCSGSAMGSVRGCVMGWVDEYVVVELMWSLAHHR